MIDIQNQEDSRNIAIDRVGVKNLSYPVTVLDRKKKTQQTIGSINMYVNLPHHFRGTHMSRFVEILNEHHSDLHIEKIGLILQKMKDKLHAQEAQMEVCFPYFIEKKAPVSGARSLMEYRCTYLGRLTDRKDFILSVQIPVTTLCPCSRELSDRGAHNQRSIVTIQIRSKKLVWIEEIIEYAEESASSPVYALLKRQDEKAVTERAYDHPMFVEDIVRDIAEKLNRDERILWYHVESENFESIHNHSACAAVEKHKTESCDSLGRFQ
ncbi:MAG TPA: GTP cyclohydrolase I FolE2 [bacterium]|nr:GTP cyclohydrolase I FolE2 [bacterium]